MNIRCYRPHGFSEEIDARWFLLPLMIVLCLLALVFLLPVQATHPDNPGRLPVETSQPRAELSAPSTGSVLTSKNPDVPISPKSRTDQQAGS